MNSYQKYLQLHNQLADVRKQVSNYTGDEINKKKILSMLDKVLTDNRTGKVQQ